ncbi:hypothetical protein OG806_48470 [Streptomyces sp. NBC_00882]|uniref:hypothetical protein n=1 Tax=Streptomyces TaxID=1883 RepID=UPI003863DD27|nr:hypothetical protein OG806_48470 [Streptomyces sp. NBC_00882]WSZ63676.1 hypothetical protein OH824_47740 [Streptomyces canus]
MTGWAINTADEEAIALLPEHVWTTALRQDVELHEITGPDGEWLSYQVAELTGLRDLTGWPDGMRLIVRRVKPSRRDAKKLTTFEKRTGSRYQIIATNIPAHHGLSGVPGFGQVWFLDALYRDHAEVEDRIKAIKRIGLGLLPSKSWQLNAAWILAGGSRSTRGSTTAVCCSKSTATSPARAPPRRSSATHFARSPRPRAWRGATE